MNSGEHLRRRLGASVVNGFLRGVSKVMAQHPNANPKRHGVEVLRDIAYDPAMPERKLDVWRPKEKSATLRRAVVYIHGGGFRILSKETHWVMALAFARQGYVVFNIDYRLAPRYPFPAAIEDACMAYEWVCAHAEQYGADRQRLVLAGESAGGNLVASLAIAACFEREEPYAQRVFRTNVLPKAVLPACGLHQVTDPGRFVRRKTTLSRFVTDRIEEVSNAYVGVDAKSGARSLDFADPVTLYERDEPHLRTLPPFFLTCGTADPLLDDTRRLHAALVARGAVSEVRYYPGEPHAFHAFVFRKHAKQHWRDTYAFLDRHVPR
jgi:acetyl esterase